MYNGERTTGQCHPRDLRGGSGPCGGLGVNETLHFFSRGQPPGGPASPLTHTPPQNHGGYLAVVIMSKVSYSEGTGTTTPGCYKLPTWEASHVNLLSQKRPVLSKASGNKRKLGRTQRK